MYQIADLKDLGKLIDLCRKKGVDSITVDNVSITLGHLPEKAEKATDQSYDMPPEASFPITSAVTMAIATEELDEEQLLFYSSKAENE